MIKTRRASALLTIATHPRMIAAVPATLAGCLALLMTFVGGLVGASTASAAILTYTVEDLGTNLSPEDINSTGQVEGEGFSIDCGRERAILYHVVPSTDIRESLIWWNGYR